MGVWCYHCALEGMAAASKLLASCTIAPQRSIFHGRRTTLLTCPSLSCRFLLPSYFPLVLRAVSSLEGVALSVDRNFKLISAGESRGS